MTRSITLRVIHSSSPNLGSRQVRLGCGQVRVLHWHRLGCGQVRGHRLVVVLQLVQQRLRGHHLVVVFQLAQQRLRGHRLVGFASMIIAYCVGFASMIIAYCVGFAS